MGEIPHGMTYKNLQQLAERLAGKLNIDQVKIMAALKEVVREDVLRVAKNEPRGE